VGLIHTPVVMHGGLNQLPVSWKTIATHGTPVLGPLQAIGFRDERHNQGSLQREREFGAQLRFSWASLYGSKLVLLRL
jgi:hypothetical protein